MRALVSDFLDLLLPPICAQCGCATETDPLCPGCDILPYLALPDDPAPPPLVSWTAAVGYEGAARDWVRRFKYPSRGLGNLDPAADGVARFWIARAAGRVPGPPPEAVIPVPLHVTRLRERGFNQSTALARDVARAVGSRAAPRALRRVRATARQTDLSRSERRRNLRGAFEATGAIPRHVWLVDDVATTGATLSEAARTLCRAGAREVRAVTLAWRPWIR